MKVVRMVSRMSASSVAFGTVALLLAGVMAGIPDPVVQLQVGETALLFLNLFLYSLSSERLRRLERRRR